MITGTIIEPPVLRFTSNGKALCKFTFQCPLPDAKPWACVAWEDIAEQIANNDKYFRPNAEITVAGYWKNSTWVTDDDWTVSRREYIIQRVWE
jgi:single-stranded DNA-binding protein